MVSTPTRSRAGNAGGGVPLTNGNAGSFSPQHVHQRQTLRETPTEDRSSARDQYDPGGASSSRRSNTMSEHAGPVHVNGNYGQDDEDYGILTSSSDAHGHLGRSYSTPEHSEAPAVAATVHASHGVHAFLAGPDTISMTTERTLPNANPHRPTFLNGIVPNPHNPGEWNGIVLPHVRTLTFTMSSTADLHFASDMLVSNQLPYVYHHITKIAYPQFFWFSGVAHNRRHNPYLQVASGLPELRELTFTLHTAGITTSAFGERQMLQIEATDPVRAKERKVMRVQEVVYKYDLGGLFFCDKLQRIRVEYIDCAMTEFFTKTGRPVDVLRDVQAYLINGFAQNGRNVFVELAKVN